MADELITARKLTQQEVRNTQKQWQLPQHPGRCDSRAKDCVTVKDSKRAQKSADKATLKKKDSIGNVAPGAKSGQIKFESLNLLVTADELITARKLTQQEVWKPQRQWRFPQHPGRRDHRAKDYVTVKGSKRAQKSADKTTLKNKDDIGNVALGAKSGQIKFESLILLMMVDELIAARKLTQREVQKPRSNGGLRNIQDIVTLGPKIA
ncbi:hypothetical protein MMC22_009985 [Lobaria immixta]|nr:hypothetical protein [Lobaria immixta]